MTGRESSRSMEKGLSGRATPSAWVRASLRGVPLTGVLLTTLGIPWLLAEPLAAQSVEGVVRGSDRQPLREAHVALLDRRRALVASAVSDEDGEFEVRAPAPGSYYVSVSRLGFHSLLDGPYELREGGTLEVWVVMHADPIPLEGITGAVERRVRRLAAVGFYERRENGFGHFMEREEFRRRAVGNVADAFRALPRVQVRENPPSLTGPGELLNPHLLVRSGGRPCPPMLYIDGVEVHRGGTDSEPLRPDDWLVPGDVEAVEVYTGAASTPLQYVGRAPCGVVLVWTRHTPLVPGAG